MKKVTTQCGEIDKKWSELKKFLGESNRSSEEKITKAQNTIYEVLKLRYDKDKNSWPKNKGLVVMYEALAGKNTTPLQKLKILRTRKTSDGEGIGYFSDWDNQLKRYFNNIVPTTEEMNLSNKELDDEVQNICKMIKENNNYKLNYHKIEVCDLVFSKKTFFKYNFDINKCKKMINNSKGHNELFEKAYEFESTFYVNEKKLVKIQS